MRNVKQVVLCLAVVIVALASASAPVYADTIYNAPPTNDWGYGSAMTDGILIGFAGTARVLNDITVQVCVSDPGPPPGYNGPAQLWADIGLTLFSVGANDTVGDTLYTTSAGFSLATGQGPYTPQPVDFPQIGITAPETMIVAVTVLGTDDNWGPSGPGSVTLAGSNGATVGSDGGEVYFGPGEQGGIPFPLTPGMAPTEQGSPFALTVAAVPEPSTLVLLGIAALGLLAYARRRRG
ncbi:MAG: PEP-CTERM sorting domain-containing protein [Thermoguttaceae bacterium]|jgi:hypothetical protein